MGRKRRDRNNKIKRVRYAAKELLRLKKTLGLIDEKGNELLKKIADVTILTDAEKIKAKKAEHKRAKDEVLEELGEKIVAGEEVEVSHPTTKTVHIYNTKTGKDQFGNYPQWHNRRAEKKKKKKGLAKRKKFNPFWNVNYVDFNK